MKVLIVTAWYHPFIHPRAHRWTALAEHWAASGHEVHVVCSRRRDCPDEAVVNGVHVHRAGFDSLKEVAYYFFGSKNARGRVGAGAQRPGLFTRLATWLYNGIWKKIYFPDDACLWYFPAKKKAKQLLASQKFDALATVSLPFTGHLIGLALVRRTSKSVQTPRVATDLEVRRTTWLADIGDPFSIQAKSLNNLFLYGKLSRRLEQKILESADAVTVTTEFTLKKYREQFGEKAVARMRVIPPLLHPLNPTPDPSPKREGSVASSRYALCFPSLLGEGSGVGLKIGYFGALYAPVRTPNAFLDLLEKTFALRPGLRGRIEVHFYGEVFPEFFKKLIARPATQLHGLRSREEVQTAMREMDVLLNVGNTTDFQLPSKAVDYLAAGKPIVNLSYTDADPFADFLKFDKSLMLNLKVRNGRIGEEEVWRWLAWLEGEKKLPSEDEIRERIAPYLVGAVAGRYQTLLSRSDTFSKSVTSFADEAPRG